MTKTTLRISAALLAFAAPAFAQDKIELKATTFVPPTHWFVTDALQPWGAEMAKRTGGKVTVRVFAGNSPFGQAANQADQVTAGVTDLAWASNGVPPNRLPRSLLMELPLMSPSSKGAAMALWSMRKSHLADDYKGFHVVGLTCTNGLGFALRDKRVSSLDDLKTLRIRAPSLQLQALLQHIGAVPVTMPPAQIYSSLEKGIIDGATTGYDGLHAFRLEGISKYFYDARISVTCFHIVMAAKRYESLPVDVKKAIDETTGDAWDKTFPALWDKADQVGRTASLAKGVTEITVAPETRAKWRAQLKPLADRQIAELEKQGISNARAIYDEMVKRAAQYAK
jgi:TRAP-type C4-dicarboxylate transport system substrate-binding protein